MLKRLIDLRLVLLLLAFLSPSCKHRSAAEFISIKDPVIALKHVRIIDGTGSPAREDQTLIIDSGRIAAIGPTAEITVPASAVSLDLTGQTAMPGLVGMHDHLFYATDGGDTYVSVESFAPLYLAAGVTTIRTAGAVNLESDLSIKKSVDAGQLAGPKIHLTSPYLDRGADQLLDLEKITESINEWADRGITSLKIYANINRAELSSIVNSAHKRGLKVTGHLCAVGFTEAAHLGIDNLEHGLLVDTEFYSRKTPDVCPAQDKYVPELARIDIKSEPVQKLIEELVSRRVAVTSTLAIFEAFITTRFHLDPRMPQVLTEEALADCRDRLAEEKYPSWPPVWDAALKKEMQFEREFVKAGGLLMTGVDPTGWGGVVAGFGDQRGVELLVEAGFSPEEAIRIATLNGATFLGEEIRIGTLTAGKQADLVIVRGNPAKDITQIRNVQFVFKDGVGYDPAKLLESVRGSVGK